MSSTPATTLFQWARTCALSRWSGCCATFGRCGKEETLEFWRIPLPGAVRQPIAEGVGFAAGAFATDQATLDGAAEPALQRGVAGLVEVGLPMGRISPRVSFSDACSSTP